MVDTQACLELHALPNCLSGPCAHARRPGRQRRAQLSPGCSAPACARRPPACSACPRARAAAQVQVQGSRAVSSAGGGRNMHARRLPTRRMRSPAPGGTRRCCLLLSVLATSRGELWLGQGHVALPASCRLPHLQERCIVRSYCFANMGPSLHPRACCDPCIWSGLPRHQSPEASQAASPSGRWDSQSGSQPHLRSQCGDL